MSTRGVDLEFMAAAHRVANRRSKRDWYSFTVEGSGPFPLDMLRYDHAWPKTEGRDSSRLATPENLEEYRTPRRVTLCTASETAPNVRRWDSFGWRVLPVEQTEI